MPALIPVTTPDVDPTDALALVVPQLPPPTSVRLIVEPWQTAPGPVIAAGNGFTVMDFVRRQPVGNV